MIRPDTESAAREIVAEMTTLDPNAARYAPDPLAHGVWLAEFGCGTRLLIYIGGHGVNCADDFEEV